ncbi:cysteinyl-tRNA synthetase [Hyphomonas neptunium ATCC 15444]|uniref:Cysteine--tRNA ligase n=2 Tax=Hyphomonas TaxID=85 RepID=SYC_HYPNA|nr:MULTISPECIES: cysteine--tRNA ligase [Hyphomonas]Q0BXB7.1 RecName: Full=Cysteine--tRNA ligase; AltName: Full=Cysteinyl-tRNA synthetase; Short=CysRS [Hyphomonas neptunium ATCC 15444]ABI76262.1 cysteinyl-tRNA synthetase [Hyphomonas neptunium ATCC 15444]KCZ86928.1 cysteinyl-tRNA ligase [Hyphomonas hirschiana VP5]
MTLRIYDTAARKKRVFEPQDAKRVTLYVCGPTVYNYAHIGNARPPVVFDVLRRVLMARYGEDAIVYARNITDIEDKIIAASVASGEPISAITQKYAAIYNADVEALNVIAPTIEPWATGHVPEMIEIIEKLIRKKYAYVGDTGVWFSVPSMPDYGRLSGRKPEDNEAGARVAVDEDKRDPSDFALWKFAKPGEPEDAIWDSPWGRGRPGWHIECSAMAAKHLGRTIDIHGGGVDLTFPHHENEIAQSECAHGEELARYWMHNGFLDMGGEKMSKSLGNVVTVHDLLKAWPGEVLRFALLTAHYRAQLDWTEDLLKQAKTTLDRIYGALRRVWEADGGEARDTGVLRALEDDLGTPDALAELARLASEANTAADLKDAVAMANGRANLLAAGKLLGLLTKTPKEWEQGADTDENSRIDAQVQARVDARVAKDWAEADRIRKALAEEGVEIMDGPAGSTWRRI